MAQDQVVGGPGGSAFIPPASDPADSGPGSPQAPKSSHFDRLKHQMNHAGARFNGLVRPIKRNVAAAFGFKASRPAEGDGGGAAGAQGDAAPTRPQPVLTHAASRISRAPSLHRSPSADSLGGLGVDSEIAWHGFDADSDVEEPETPLARRPRARVRASADATPEVTPHEAEAEPAEPPPTRPAAAIDVPWPPGHVPSDAEITQLVTRFLARLMPDDSEAQTRRTLNPLLKDAIGGMREDAASAAKPGPAPTSKSEAKATTETETKTETATITLEQETTAEPKHQASPSGPGSSFMQMLDPEALVAGENGQGGGDGSHFDKYQERATSLQMQAAKMQLTMSVVSAIADLVKTVGSKLESAASRG